MNQKATQLLGLKTDALVLAQQIGAAIDLFIEELARKRSRPVRRASGQGHRKRKAAGR
jgi:hypothetical protein